MTLWDLLTIICFAMPIGGAHSAAKQAGIGFGGHAVAILVGLFVGAGCACVMRVVGKLVVTRLEKRPADARENPLRVLYFAAFLWSFFGLFIGGWSAGLLTPLLR